VNKFCLSVIFNRPFASMN